MAEPEQSESDLFRIAAEIELKVEPLEEEELGMKELISRLLVLEQQVTACLENQPLIHQVFHKCNRLEQRLRKLDVRLNKMPGGTSDKRQKANADSEDLDDMHGNDPGPDWRPDDGDGSEPETEYHADGETPTPEEKPRNSLRSRTRATSSRYSRNQSSPDSVNPVKAFRCKVCSPFPEQLSFEDAESLATHYVETHPITGPMGPNTNTSRLCRRSRTIEVQAQSSKRRGRKFRKPKSQAAWLGQAMKTMMRRRKAEKPLVACPKGCQKWFNFPGPPERHLMSCPGAGPGPYQCELCPSILLNRGSYYEHKLKVHSEKNNVLCDTCGKSLTIGGLKYHMKIHAGEDRRKHICEKCGAKFTTLLDLQIHNRTHTGERPFPCSECSRRFKSKATLKIHMIRHNGRECEHCGEKFGSRYHLWNHRRREHAEAEAAAATSIKRKVREPRATIIAPTPTESDSSTAPAPVPPPGLPPPTPTPDQCETPIMHQDQEGESAHFIGRTNAIDSGKHSRKRCYVCSHGQLKKETRTMYICKQCNVPLCLEPCFEIYHTR